MHRRFTPITCRTPKRMGRTSRLNEGGSSPEAGASRSSPARIISLLLPLFVEGAQLRVDIHGGKLKAAAHEVVLPDERPVEGLHGPGFMGFVAQAMKLIPLHECEVVVPPEGIEWSGGFSNASWPAGL